MCIEIQQNALNSPNVIVLWYIPLLVWVGPAFFRVTFLLQEYSVIKCVRLLDNIEVFMIIG
jgi:hypothetical protein